MQIFASFEHNVVSKLVSFDLNPKQKFSKGFI